MWQDLNVAAKGLETENSNLKPKIAWPSNGID